jgi:hypothetical protein
MKFIAALYCILSINLSIGQVYNFKPNWKKDDMKHMIITKNESKFKNDTLTVNQTNTTHGRLKVLRNNKENYKIEIVMENQMLSATKYYFEERSDELEKYKDLKMLYSINKSNFQVELLNWQELQHFMSNCIEDITRSMHENYLDAMLDLEMVIIQMREIISKKENIDSFFGFYADCLLIPYNKDFKLGETIVCQDSVANPFSQNKNVLCTTMLTLSSIENDQKTCKINQEIQYDLTEYKRIMSKLFESLTKQFGEKETIPKEQIISIEKFEIQQQNNQVTTYDLATTWITDLVLTSITSTTNPLKGIKERTENIVSIVIR